VLVEEPDPVGERRVVIEGPGATAHLEVAYRAPTVGHPDFVPTLVLGTVLGGPITLGFGGGGENRSSRLYRALVETELAVDVDCNVQGTIDPYLLDVPIMLRSGRSHAEVETALDRVIDGIVSDPIPEAELAKARKQVMAQFVFGNERITSRAMMLMLAHTVFTKELLRAFPDRIATVTAEEVRRVAERIFQKKNRVVGWYVPLETSGRAEDGQRQDDETA
jgi:zinc protease